jgi:four helix bundle protein
LQNFEKLEIWNQGIELATEIYKITRNFPKSEIYGMCSQLQRAAVSVPSNIAEGSTRQYKKEFINFLYVSRGSLSELLTQLKISLNINYINEDQYNNLSEKIYVLTRRINKLIDTLKNNKAIKR